MTSQSHRTAPVFVPHLLKLPVAPRSGQTPSHPFCPVRHQASTTGPVVAPPPGPVRATLTPKAPPSTSSISHHHLKLPPTIPCQPSVPPASPAQTEATPIAPDAPLSPDHAVAPLPPDHVSASASASASTSASAPVFTAPAAAAVGDKPIRRQRRKHTDQAREKIRLANRGNVPWNKGKPHSEETRRKISENTRNAMRRPEVRELLKRQATGRRHTEQTKMKIRRTVRLARAAASPPSQRVPKVSRDPIPFNYEPDAIEKVNKEVDAEIEHVLVQRNESSRYSFTKKRPMAQATKDKLRDRIKELWKDPDYRQRVRVGTDARSDRIRRSREEEEEASDDMIAPKRTGLSPARKRSRKARSESESGEAEDGDAMEGVQVGNEEVARDNDRVDDADAEEEEEEEEEDYFEDDDREILLPPGMLGELTTADLGLSGQDAAGPVSGFGFGETDLLGVDVNETEDLSERLERSELGELGELGELNGVSVPSPSVSDVVPGTEVDVETASSPFGAFLGNTTGDGSSDSGEPGEDNLDNSGNVFVDF